MGTGALEGLLAAARRIARTRQQAPSTAHVLLTMLQSDPETSRILAQCQVRESDLISALKVVANEPTSAMEVAVERSAVLASRVGSAHARPIHLLIAMLREPRSSAYRCLEEAGSHAAKVRQQLEAVVQATGTPNLDARVHEPRIPSAPRTRAVLGSPKLNVPPKTSSRELAKKTGSEVPANRKIVQPEEEKKDEKALAPTELDPKVYPLLTSLGRNLTDLARRGEIDPVFGRTKEIEHLLDALGRRRANNPLLIGPPGVGKTALVEGFALSSLRDGDPRIVIELSAGSLVAGTGVRGALSEKIGKLVAELARAQRRIVVFLDEIHAIAGGDGSEDLASELKSALARGVFPCIGATTFAEYKRHLERDPALVRRFTRIEIEEPSAEATFEILSGIAPRYEEHHRVAFSDDTLRASIELSLRFLPEKHLPDKALSCLDLAAARVRRAGRNRVEVPDIAKVIADEAHVPLDRLLVRDAERLLALEAHLERHVVGQTAARLRIADALRKGAAGFRGKRPLGSFLFLGPTGVGKTETAKAIAELLFGPSGMLRLDMSEYGEAHSVARLFGAPPGYVGHDDGGQLTEAVRARPYQLVLLDEIEKAHPEVWMALLPLLEEGCLTDGRGRRVDFTNTVVVMTSNLGANVLRAPRKLGFDAAGTDQATDVEERVLREARRVMPPELWNRIEEPLVYLPLGQSEVREIARRMLDGVAKTMDREHSIRVTFEESAIDTLIAAGGFDQALGARPMRRLVGRLVESALATRILSGDVRKGDDLVVSGHGHSLSFEHRESADAAE